MAIEVSTISRPSPLQIAPSSAKVVPMDLKIGLQDLVAILR